ncbi:MAG: carbon monoxide dehydrogenase subunit G [Nitrososphaeria archaeon]
MPQFKGSEVISAPRQAVWDFLTDPQKVGGCVPGLKSLQVVDSDHFNAEVQVGIGILRGTVKVKYEVVEKVPPERITMRMDGSGVGSKALINATVELKEAQQGTQLDWVADVTVSGTLAGLGARYLNDIAFKTVSDIFKCTKEKLSK